MLAYEAGPPNPYKAHLRTDREKEARISWSSWISGLTSSWVLGPNSELYVILRDCSQLILTNPGSLKGVCVWPTVCSSHGILTIKSKEKRHPLLCGAQDAQMARLELHPEEGGTHDCNPGLCNVFIWLLGLDHAFGSKSHCHERGSSECILFFLYYWKMDVNLKQINQAFYLTCGLVVKLVAIKHCRKVWSHWTWPIIEAQCLPLFPTPKNSGWFKRAELNLYSRIICENVCALQHSPSRNSRTIHSVAILCLSLGFVSH